MNTTLAERLNEAMKDNGVTPGELAAACGVKVQAVYQWQSGKTKKLDGSNLLNASRRLGVRPEWLSTGVGRRVSGVTAPALPHNRPTLFQAPPAGAFSCPSNIL